jgi:periplasmic divalent cation tolerance protein
MPMPDSPTPIRLVLTTASSPGAASRLARALVDERLAACATLLPGATSIYRWKGQLETADEVVLLIKTTEEQLAALEKRLKELHSYETPEFLVLKVEGGSAEYLAWLQSSVGAPQGES